MGIITLLLILVTASTAGTLLVIQESQNTTPDAQQVVPQDDEPASMEEPDTTPAEQDTRAPERERAQANNQTPPEPLTITKDDLTALIDKLLQADPSLSTKPAQNTQIPPPKTVTTQKIPPTPTRDPPTTEAPTLPDPPPTNPDLETPSTTDTPPETPRETERHIFEGETGHTIVQAVYANPPQFRRLMENALDADALVTFYNECIPDHYHRFPHDPDEIGLLTTGSIISAVCGVDPVKIHVDSLYHPTYNPNYYPSNAFALEVENEIIKQSNAARRDAGLRALKRHAALDAVAILHANDMQEKRYFSHPSKGLEEYRFHATSRLNWMGYACDILENNVWTQ